MGLRIDVVLLFFVRKPISLAEGCLTGMDCLTNDEYNYGSTVEMTLKEAIVLEPVNE